MSNKSHGTGKSMSPKQHISRNIIWFYPFDEQCYAWNDIIVHTIFKSKLFLRYPSYHSSVRRCSIQYLFLNIMNITIFNKSYLTWMIETKTIKNRFFFQDCLVHIYTHRHDPTTIIYNKHNICSVSFGDDRHVPTKLHSSHPDLIEPN